MNEKTVKAKWESYAAHVLPKDCDPVQRRETRRAFYAGAFAMLMMSSYNVHQLSDEEGVNYIEGLRRECLSFGREVAEGGG